MALEGETPTESEPSSLAADLPSSRAAMAAPSVGTPSIESAARPPAREIQGSVVDASAMTVPLCPIVLRANSSDPLDGTRALSDAAGRFHLSVGADGLLVSDHPTLTPLFFGSVGPRQSSEVCTIVVVPKCVVAGRVVDSDGAPIRGATVNIGLDIGLRERIDAPLENSRLREWQRTTDTGGSFRFEDAPIVEGATIEASCESFVEVFGISYPAANEELTVRLERKADVGTYLQGRVVDARGAPVPRARVLFQGDDRRSRDDGTFDFEIQGPPAAIDSEDLVALHERFVPVRAVARPGQNVLTLRDASPTIHGRVLHADSTPATNAHIECIGPATVNDIRRFLGLRDSEWDDGDRVFDAPETWTEEDGGFEIEIPPPFPLRLRAVDLRTLAEVDSIETSPGQPIELRLPGDDETRSVAGRVVDPRGGPIGGARVTVRRVLPDGGQVCSEQVLTSDAGRFAFERIHGDELAVLVETNIADSKSFPCSPGSEASDLRLTVGRQGRLRVETVTPGLKVETMRVFGTDGRALYFECRQGGGGSASEEWDLGESWTGPLLVSEEATTLVLFRGDIEVLRTPIRIVPGETTLVRL